MVRTSFSAQRILLVLGIGLLLAGLIPSVSSASSFFSRSDREASIAARLDAEKARRESPGRAGAIFSRSAAERDIVLPLLASNGPGSTDTRIGQLLKGKHGAGSAAGLTSTSQPGAGTSPVPEPSTALLMLLGLAGLRCAGSRRTD